ncbi:MAG: hypothetical protein PVG66_00555 [Chromatiales bacterium]|jgi:hypothetical protein
MKLIQRHLFKGTQEFELLDEVLRVRINTPMKKKQTEITLATLNPEPIVNGSRLEFYGRVKCSPLFSLYRDKPNAAEFNTFVDALKERALKEFNAFAGIK